MSAILPESINTENECEAAEAWGEEDAIQGNGSCAPQYFIPGSLQWDAYYTGYNRGRQLIQTLREYDPIHAYARNRLPARLPRESPGLWGLRGYEDALFNRPIRSKFPPFHTTDHDDYHAGYKEGTAMNSKILAAAGTLRVPGRRRTFRNS